MERVDKAKLVRYPICLSCGGIMAMYAIGSLAGFAAGAAAGLAGRALSLRAGSSHPSGLQNIIGDTAAVCISGAVSHLVPDSSPFWSGASLGASAVSSSFVYLAGYDMGLKKVNEGSEGRVITETTSFHDEVRRRAAYRFVPIALFVNATLGNDFTARAIVTYLCGMFTVYSAAKSIQERRSTH